MDPSSFQTWTKTASKTSETLKGGKWNSCPGKTAGMPTANNGPQSRDYLGGGPLCGCSPTHLALDNGPNFPNDQDGYQFEDAAHHCEEEGMRLCSYHELNSD